MEQGGNRLTSISRISKPFAGLNPFGAVGTMLVKLTLGFFDKSMAFLDMLLDTSQSILKLTVILRYHLFGVASSGLSICKGLCELTPRGDLGGRLHAKHLTVWEQWRK